MVNNNDEYEKMLLDNLRKFIFEDIYRKRIVHFMVNGPDLIFRGQLLAKVGNLHVFKTDKNKYVCIDDDLIKRRVAVFSEENEIVNFFGFGVPAKKLYEKIGINKDLYIMDLTK